MSAEPTELTRIEILKKIQELCQDESHYLQFEKVLKEYLSNTENAEAQSQQTRDKEFPKDFSK